VLEDAFFDKALQHCKKKLFRKQQMEENKLFCSFVGDGQPYQQATDPVPIQRIL
jgi:hypothetical protein